MAASLQSLTHVAVLAERFDHFIVDLWGVIHDGQHPYPNVLQTLAELKKRRKQIIFLSNAPRRASRAVEVLGKLGIGSSLYDHVLTSGEATYHYLARDGARLGKRYVYLGPQKDRDLCHGLPLEEVASPADAQFAIATGFDHDASTLEEKLPLIEDCLAARLPLICANPDYEVVRQDGSRLLCAGVIAEAYAKRGGAVQYFGKPYPDVYRECMDFFENPPRERVVAIGDNLLTDIKGAKDQGFHSVLCTGGILAETLGCRYGEMPGTKALEALFAIEQVRPDSTLPAFWW
jgi:HAD superfamily hydrolase (TIGR01459 family)